MDSYESNQKSPSSHVCAEVKSLYHVCAEVKSLYLNAYVLLCVP